MDYQCWYYYFILSYIYYIFHCFHYSHLTFQFSRWFCHFQPFHLIAYCSVQVGHQHPQELPPPHTWYRVGAHFSASCPQWGSVFASTKDPRTTSISCGRNPESRTGTAPSLIQSVWKGNTIFGTPRFGTPEGERAGDSEEEISPSPNMRRVFTRLQDWKNASPRGGSSAVRSLGSHLKEGAAQKKHRSS